LRTLTLKGNPFPIPKAYLKINNPQELLETYFKRNPPKKP
jgi:hypothetical protein